MDDQIIEEFNEHRRANRVAWVRLVRITEPVQTQGSVLDASAVGLRVRVEARPGLRLGDWVTLEIPRADGQAVLSRHARIARLEVNGSELELGLELG
jgi:hypothetical protein